MRAYQWAVMQATLDPGAESEQKGMRPVLIVSNEEFNQALSNVTVLPLTSTRRNLYPAEVFLPSGIAGQPSDSIIMAHQIRTISKKRLTDLLVIWKTLNFSARCARQSKSISVLTNRPKGAHCRLKSLSP
jgi:mRNA interferase MazF